MTGSEKEKWPGKRSTEMQDRENKHIYPLAPERERLKP